MASYKQDAKNKTWSVRYRSLVFDKIVEKRKRGFKTKKEAEYWYSKERLKKNIEQNPDPITLEQLNELYQCDIKERLKASSIKSSCDVIRLYIIPYFGNYRVDKLTPQDIRNWKTDINKKGFSYKYKAKIYAAFSGMLNFGKKYYGLTTNVVNICGNFTNIELKKEINFWTENDFKNFIKIVNEQVYKVFFSLLYLTGARKGEANALTWSDINFDKNIIMIRKSVNRKGLQDGVSYEITSPKNKASYRDILMPEKLKSLLLEYKNALKKIEGFNDNCFIFGVNKPLTDQSIRRKMIEAAKRANVKQIRVHDLRHSHASLLINKGQNILIVSQRLGHSDVTQTLNTYGHLFPNAQREIIEALNFDFD